MLSRTRIPAEPDLRFAQRAPAGTTSLRIGEGKAPGPDRVNSRIAGLARQGMPGSPRTTAKIYLERCVQFRHLYTTEEGENPVPQGLSSSTLQDIPANPPSATMRIYTQVNTTEEVLEDTLVLTSHSLYPFFLPPLIIPLAQRKKWVSTL